jgi:hypothetical protein
MIMRRIDSPMSPRVHAHSFSVWRSRKRIDDAEAIKGPRWQSRCCMVAIASPSALPASASTSSGLDERAPHERTACPSTSTPSSRRRGHGRVRLRADWRRGPVHDPPGSEPLPAAESSLFHDHPTPPVGASLPVYVSDGTRRWAIHQQGVRPGSVGGRPEAGNDAFPGGGSVRAHGAQETVGDET